MLFVVKLSLVGKLKDWIRIDQDIFWQFIFNIFSNGKRQIQQSQNFLQKLICFKKTFMRKISYI